MIYFLHELHITVCKQTINQLFTAQRKHLNLQNFTSLNEHIILIKKNNNDFRVQQLIIDCSRTLR